MREYLPPTLAGVGNLCAALSAPLLDSGQSVGRLVRTPSKSRLICVATPARASANVYWRIDLAPAISPNAVPICGALICLRVRAKGAGASQRNRSLSSTESTHQSAHTHEPKGTQNMSRNARKYGLGKFLFDVILVLITGGLWLIWIFVRELRGLRR